MARKAMIKGKEKRNSSRILERISPVDFSERQAGVRKDRGALSPTRAMGSRRIVAGRLAIS